MGQFPPGPPLDLGFLRDLWLLSAAPAGSPQANSGVITSISPVTTSSLRDPRSPPRPRSLDPTRSDSDSTLRHPRQFLQDRRREQRFLCTWLGFPSRITALLRPRSGPILKPPPPP